MLDFNFFDASFVFCLGFILFMVGVIKYGYRKSTKLLDSEINKIKATLDHALLALKAEEERSIQVQQAEKQLDKEIDTLQKSVERRLSELQNITDNQINSILLTKQSMADSALDLMRHETILELRDMLTDQACNLIIETISTQTDKTVHDSINDRSILNLKSLLTTKGLTNDNGDSPRQAIA